MLDWVFIYYYFSQQKVFRFLIKNKKQKIIKLTNQSHVFYPIYPWKFFPEHTGDHT